jgi:hypothetical protein
MSKRRLLRDNMIADDLKGFEDFIEAQPDEARFLPKPPPSTAMKKEANFENLTFLQNDSSRLTKIKDLLSNKLPFSEKFSNSEKIIKEQQREIVLLRKQLFQVADRPNSPYRRSLKELFDGFFGTPPAGD